MVRIFWMMHHLADGSHDGMAEVISNHTQNGLKSFQLHFVIQINDQEQGLCIKRPLKNQPHCSLTCCDLEELFELFEGVPANMFRSTEASADTGCFANQWDISIETPVFFFMKRVVLLDISLKSWIPKARSGKVAR